ncbi:MAG: peroxiredoxin [Thermoplasmata archaeon]|jgi:thioredoxin-dependent peroxiredoxin
MLEVGDVAPDFTAPSASGQMFQLSSLRGRPVILFFFPRANSLGCTIETRAFADHFSEIQAAGVSVVGVSVDPVTAQKSFATKCDVSFPLVSDGDKSVARAYGVLGFLGFARRVTFFLNEAGRVDEVVEAIGPNPHVKRALERIARGSGPSPTKGPSPP